MYTHTHCMHTCWRVHMQTHVSACTLTNTQGIITAASPPVPHGPHLTWAQRSPPPAPGPIPSKPVLKVTCTVCSPGDDTHRQPLRLRVAAAALVKGPGFPLWWGVAGTPALPEWTVA